MHLLLSYHGSIDSFNDNRVQWGLSLIGTRLGDILCEHFARTVGNDNCARFDALSLKIPADR